MAYAVYKNNPVAEFLFANTKMAAFWLVVRLHLGWKVAGHWGIDRWLLPKLGTPWQPVSAFKRSKGD